MKNGSALNSPMNDLRKDFQAVARDTEALLKATADIATDRVQEARARTEQTLRETFDNLYDRGMRRRVRKAVRQTDGYVRDHSWTIIGAAAGVALLIGLIGSSRRH
jgi:ElaB/YqjD/DUF883 family membrane-anchored ribosome-binding protein